MTLNLNCYFTKGLTELETKQILQNIAAQVGLDFSPSSMKEDEISGVIQGTSISYAASNRHVYFGESTIQEKNTLFTEAKKDYFFRLNFESSAERHTEQFVDEEAVLSQMHQHLSGLPNVSKIFM